MSTTPVLAALSEPAPPEPAAAPAPQLPAPAPPPAPAPVAAAAPSPSPTFANLHTLAPWATAALHSRGLLPPRASTLARVARTQRAVTTVPAWTARDMIPGTIPPPRFLLEPWLPLPGLAMVHAPCGTGKTWLALAISLAVASGGSVLGWRAPRPLNVLHIDGETPLGELQSRLHALLAGAQHDPQRPYANRRLVSPERLRLVVADALGTGVLDLMTPAGQLALAAHLRDADLIVVDSLASLFGDQAEGRDWRPAEEWLLSLRRQAKGVLLVHHSGKGGRPLGAARQEFALDAVLALQPADTTPNGLGATFTLRVEKLRARFEPLMQPRTVRLATVDGASRWVGVAPQEEKVTQVATLWAEGRPLRWIASWLGMSKSAAHRCLQRSRDPFDGSSEDGGTIDATL